MTMKSDAKFEEKLTLGSKNTKSLKMCTLMCYFCVKSTLCLSRKSTEDLFIITPKNDAKFEEKLT